MAEYYVIRDKNTGLYFRGKGTNRWGKYYNQASIYRIKGTAEHTIKDIAWHGEKAEIVPVQILETAADVEKVKHGQWIERHHDDGDRVEYILYHCSICDSPDARKRNYCRNCGAKMDRGENHE